MEHGNQADRIQIKHRHGLTLVACHRIIAGQRENIVKSLRCATPGRGLQTVSIQVFAREVNDQWRAPGLECSGNPIGRQHRIAAGVVGDGNPPDPRVRSQRFTQFNELGRLARVGDAARRHQFSAIKESFRLHHLAERQGAF